jgi:endoglucanase
VLNAAGSVVFEGKLHGPVADPFAGEEVWSGRFSDLRAAGTYTLRLPDGTVSWPFKIDRQVYVEALHTAIVGLYASRCGYAVREPSIAHPPCHTQDGQFILQDGRKIPDARDVKGAWHNGGDYRRSTMSAAQTVSRILWPLEMYPEAYDNVPAGLAADERWGRQPDALAEAKWGLDWLMKMQFEGGGVSIGLGPETNIMPGQIPPDTDVLLNCIGAAYSVHTAKAGAVFAKAARLLRARDPAYADRCLERALACWRYLQKHPGIVAPETCVTYTQKQDAPDRRWLAVELYRTTGKDEYHTAFKKGFTTLESPYPAAPVGTQTIRSYNLHEALISYCFLGDKADPVIRQKIIAGLTADCGRMISAAGVRGYGNVLENENWKQRHTVGNTLQLAWELAMASELTGETAYRQAALDQVHFIFGRNPLGKVFATGLGSNPVCHPHYRPSYGKTPPPGLLVKGPTLDPAFLAKGIIPRFKNPVPPMKSYLDLQNTHWCNEPDIEVQGHLIGLLAWADASSAGRSAPSE